MEYRHLGSSGLQVSALSFGSWVTFGTQIGEEVAFECMAAAYDAGVNFFDNAEVYAQGESEVMMGKVLKKAPWKRSDLVISTKIFWGGKAQVVENMKAIDVAGKITPEVMERIEGVLGNRPEPVQVFR